MSHDVLCACEECRKKKGPQIRVPVRQPVQNVWDEYPPDVELKVYNLERYGIGDEVFYRYVEAR